MKTRPANLEERGEMDVSAGLHALPIDVVVASINETFIKLVQVWSRHTLYNNMDHLRCVSLRRSAGLSNGPLDSTSVDVAEWYVDSRLYWR